MSSTASSSAPLRKKKSNLPWMNIVKKMGNKKKNNKKIKKILSVGRNRNCDNEGKKCDEILKMRSSSTIDSLDSSSPTSSEIEDMQNDGEVDSGSSPANKVETAIQVPTPNAIVRVPTPLQSRSVSDIHGSMDIGQSFEVWTRDIQHLVLSPEFQRMFHSTGGLILKTTDVAIKTFFLPVTLPIKITSSVAGNIIGFAKDALGSIIQHQPRQQQQLQLTTSLDSTELEGENEAEESSPSEAPHEQLLNAALGFIPFAFDAVSKIKDEVGSALLNVVTGQQNIQYENVNVSADSTDTTCSRSLDTKQIDPVQTETCAILAPSPNSFTMRICDLNMYSVKDSKSKLVQIELSPFDDKNELMTLAIDNMVEIAAALAMDDPVGSLEHLMSPLVQSTAVEISSSFENESSKTSFIGQSSYEQVRWKEEWFTGQHIKTIRAKKSVGNISSNEKVVSLLEKELLIWSGSLGSKGYGRKIPMLKARGIIANVSPLRLIEIFMDSSKVHTYNKYTNGRRDLRVLQEGDKDRKQEHEDTENNRFFSLTSPGMTKIVENETKVPLSNKTISITTILHARPLHDGNDDEFIIVSRSLNIKKLDHDQNGNKDRNTKVDDLAQAVAAPGSKNEIIWGVNLLRKVPGYINKVDLTTFSQMNSSAVPGFLAEKVGMMGANDFFKGLRNMQQ